LSANLRTVSNSNTQERVLTYTRPNRGVGVLTHTGHTPGLLPLLPLLPLLALIYSPYSLYSYICILVHNICTLHLYICPTHIRIRAHLYLYLVPMSYVLVQTIKKQSPIPLFPYSSIPLFPYRPTDPRWYCFCLISLTVQKISYLLCRIYSGYGPP
jgi:hypothetical protein